MAVAILAQNQGADRLNAMDQWTLLAESPDSAAVEPDLVRGI
ncbi:MAG: hypothetical protein RH862_01615 [Leptospiraceae bacterium]